jgi:hypothetical protein
MRAAFHALRAAPVRGAPRPFVDRERLAELANMARAAQADTAGTSDRHALSQPDIEQSAHTLDRKLSMLHQGERVRAVSGVGYILWR